MFKLSTYFIKGQIPGVTLKILLNIYKDELEDQSVNHITVEDNSLKFANDLIRFSMNRYANRYSNFTSGKITITDTGDEYAVDLEADTSRIYISAGILAGAMTLLILCAAGFTAVPLIAGCAFFALLIAIGYISLFLFPIYFTNLRDTIERELQEKIKHIQQDADKSNT